MILYIWLNPGSDRLVPRPSLTGKLESFFFSQNLASHASQGTEFLKLVKMLRPGYTPPRRDRLGGEILDAALML